MTSAHTPHILMILTSHRLDCFRLAIDCLVRGGSAERFDKVVVLCNGVVGAHRRYVDSLPRRFPAVHWDFIHGPRGKGWRISNLQNECVRRYPGALYFKIDEDVFVSGDWDLRLLETYEQYHAHPDLALVSATIPNNALGAWKLLRDDPGARAEFLRLPHADWQPDAPGSCDAVWAFPHLAIWLIRRYLSIDAAQHQFRALPPDTRWLEWHARFSINCILYDYRHWCELGGVQEHDEVDWGDWIRQRNALVVFDGHAICQHYTFFVQQDWLDRTGLLEELRRANVPGTSSALDPLRPALRLFRQLPRIVRRRLGATSP